HSKCGAGHGMAVGGCVWGKGGLDAARAIGFYIVHHASFSFLKPLLQRGISVYLYEKGFFHAKTICIDGKLAYVGTVNLDIRSFYINFEVSAAISDPQLCLELQEQFERDKTHSTLLTLEGWFARPRWKRGVDSVCRLLA